MSTSYAAETPSTDAEEESIRKNSLAYDDKASSPVCGSSKATAIAVTTIFVSATILAVSFYLIAATTPFKWIFAAAVTFNSLATITIIQNMVLFACLYSFVRHPVIRDLNGNYITCENPKIIFSDTEKSSDKAIEICPNHEYIKVSEYLWPKNKAPYSDFIEFCHREAAGGLNTAKLDAREYETNEDLINNKQRIGGSIACKTLKAGKTVRVHSVRFGASYDGDKICVNAVGVGGTNWFPQPLIGCHLREPVPPPPLCKKSVAIRDANNKITAYDNSKCMGCYVSSACLGSKGSLSHAPLPMTAIIVQCLKESLGNILNGCIDGVNTQTTSTSAASTQGNKIGFLNTAKAKLKNAVKAVLALAIILFGIKALLGAISSYTEVMLFIVKVALVIYFAIGNGMNYYYNELANLSLGLTDKVMLSANINKVCDYKGSEYIYPSVKQDTELNERESEVYRNINLNNVKYNTRETIKNAKSLIDPNNKLSSAEFNDFLDKFTLKSYSYLAIWDRLDCRAVFYLGQSVTQGVGYSILSALLIIPGALFIGQIIITICVLLFVMVLLMLIIWSVHIFILSLIAITIITLFAPLFVPMCLFQFTRGFFDGWLKELITFALYPVIIFTFLGIVFVTFDKLYFDDLKFKRVVDTKTDNVRAIFTYILDPKNQCDKKDSNLSCIVSDINFVTKPLIFGINVTAVDLGKGSSELWSKFAILAIMGFFFWHFIKIMGSLAAELSGSFRANIGAGVTSPTDMATNVIATAVAAGKSLGSKSGESDKDKEDKDKKKREGVSGGSTDDKKEKSSDDDKKSSNTETKIRTISDTTSITDSKGGKSLPDTNDTNPEKSKGNFSRATDISSIISSTNQGGTTSIQSGNVSITSSISSSTSDSSTHSYLDAKGSERSADKITSSPDSRNSEGLDKNEDTSVKGTNENTSVKSRAGLSTTTGDVPKTNKDD